MSINRSGQEWPSGTVSDMVQAVVHPKHCPICGSKQFVMAPDWEAHSLDNCDIHNVAIITEYICRDDKCSRSFWI